MRSVAVVNFLWDVVTSCLNKLWLLFNHMTHICNKYRAHIQANHLGVVVSCRFIQKLFRPILPTLVRSAELNRMHSVSSSNYSVGFCIVCLLTASMSRKDKAWQILWKQTDNGYDMIEYPKWRCCRLAVWPPPSNATGSYKLSMSTPDGGGIFLVGIDELMMRKPVFIETLPFWLLRLYVPWKQQLNSTHGLEGSFV